MMSKLIMWNLLTPRPMRSRVEVFVSDSSGAVLVGLAACLLLSGLAEAQEPAAPSPRADSSVVAPGAANEQVSGLKSGTTALMWSLLGTAVPVVAGSLALKVTDADKVPSIAIVGGLIIGPSFGHFYAGRPVRALTGIGVRTLTGVGIAAATGQMIGEGNDHSLEVLGLACGALFAVDVVWDIATAPQSARTHNDQLRAGRTAFLIAPTLGAAGVGLRAVVTF